VGGTGREKREAGSLLKEGGKRKFSGKRLQKEKGEKDTFFLL